MITLTNTKNGACKHPSKIKRTKSTQLEFYTAGAEGPLYIYKIVLSFSFPFVNSHPWGVITADWVRMVRNKHAQLAQHKSFNVV